MAAARIYLDAGGSAPLSARTRDALSAGFADGWADPGRLHAESRRARALLEGAADAIAEAIGVRMEDVHFTASPHEAFNRVIAGIFSARRGRERIVVSAIERDALVHAAAHASSDRLSTVPVSAAGHIGLDDLAEAMRVPDVALLAVQHANQEIGTVQDLAAVSALAQRAAVPLIVDATASIGHVDPPAHWDALVAHPGDWGGPAGLGVVALRPQLRWLPAWPEGDPWAPGNVSVPLALAAAVALQERLENLHTVSRHMSDLVRRLREQLALVAGIDVVGDPDMRLPHVLTFSCLYADGEALVAELDRRGFAVGSGSACATGTLEPSRVLAAIGALTHGNVRIALPPAATHAEVERFLAAVVDVVGDLRTRSGAPRLG